MTRSVMRPGFRRVAVGSAAVLLALAGVGVSAAPASASARPTDTTITVRYPVSGSTHLAAPNATLPLGPGKLTATADLNTGTVTANLALPDATGSFEELNAIPVTATAQLINDGPTTGTVNLDTGAVATTSKITMRIVDLTVGGVPTPVGNYCETATPVTVQVSSQPGWNILKGGTLEGTYTMPPFAHCLLATLLINLTLPGPGNTITLNAGKGKVIH